MQQQQPPHSNTDTIGSLLLQTIVYLQKVIEEYEKRTYLRNGVRCTNHNQRKVKQPHITTQVYIKDKRPRQREHRYNNQKRQLYGTHAKCIKRKTQQ